MAEAAGRGEFDMNAFELQRVQLPQRCEELSGRAFQVTPGIEPEYIFPGRKSGSPKENVSIVRIESAADR